jgi:hypothetical protein
LLASFLPIHFLDAVQRETVHRRSEIVKERTAVKAVKEDRAEVQWVRKVRHLALVNGLETIFAASMYWPLALFMICSIFNSR